MTIQHSPAPARSDVATTAQKDSAPARPFLLHGRMLSLGALAWALSLAVFGPDPHEPLPLVLFGLGSGLFQIGLLFLLRVLWRTQALGEGRIARAVLRAEAVAISLAMCSTFVDAIAVSDLSQPGWLALDAFWPLSMLGMFLIGIRIAVAGRWSGVSRFWPVVAESWAVITVPSNAIFGQTVGGIVGCIHLVVGYAVLGVIVSRKTD